MRIPISRSAPKWFTGPVVDVLTRLRISPNQVTLAGLAGILGAMVLAANGHFLLAGIAVLAASALDVVDGALARATDQATPFGSAFDATVDRVSEAAILFGLLWYFADRGGSTEEILIFLAVVGSLLVSYVRARAEIINIKMTDGLFTRFERVILVGVALIVQGALNWDLALPLALGTLAVLTFATALQRLALILKRTSQAERHNPA